MGDVECSMGGKSRDSRLISGFDIDHWRSVINSFDRGIKCSIADADDDRHAMHALRPVYSDTTQLDVELS